MKGKRGKRMQWAVCFGKTAISAAILAACLCGMSAKTARADVIWTPEDSFYEKNYDFVCIKTPKNEIVGTMVIFQGKVVWKTQNDYIDDEDIVLDFEEWSKEDIGISKGLTLIIVK